jgi:predicted transglutaminase-like cysteine proteinase
MQYLGIKIKDMSFSLLFVVVGLSIGACSTTSPVSSKIQLSSVVTPPSGLVAFCADVRAKCHVGIEQDKNTHTVSTGGHGVNRHLRLADFAGHAKNEQPQTPSAIALQATEGETGASKITSVFDSVIQQGMSVPTNSPGTVLPGNIQTPKTASRIEVSADVLPAVKKVNLQINNKITWQSDLDRYGLEERWTMPLAFDLGKFGDCEDFALEKRRLLLEMGIPAGALALATTTSKATGSHALLVIRTTQGDYVLDNTTPWVLPWTETNYKWITIQEGGNLLQWRAVASREMDKTKS